MSKEKRCKEIIQSAIKQVCSLELIKAILPTILAGVMGYYIQSSIFNSQAKKEFHSKVFSEYLVEKDDIQKCIINLSEYSATFFENGTSILNSAIYEIYHEKIRECAQKFQKLYYLSIYYKVVISDENKNQMKSCLNNVINLKNISYSELKGQTNYLDFQDKYNDPLTSCWRKNKDSIEKNLEELALIND